MPLFAFQLDWSTCAVHRRGWRRGEVGRSQRSGGPLAGRQDGIGTHPHRADYQSADGGLDGMGSGHTPSPADSFIESAGGSSSWGINKLVHSFWSLGGIGMLSLYLSIWLSKVSEVFKPLGLYSGYLSFKSSMPFWGVCLVFLSYLLHFVCL